MARKRKKNDEYYKCAFHTACTKQFYERMGKAAAAKGMYKSFYVRYAIEETMKRDGF